MRILFYLFSALCQFLGVLLALALLAAGLMALSDGWNKYVYLLDIFTVPITSVAITALGLFALMRQPAASLLTLLAVLCLGLSLAPDRNELSLSGQGYEKGAPVRIVFANLLVRNQTPAALIPWIEAQSPDIIALVEANDRAHSDLIPALRHTYPYVAQRHDIYIVSRYPLDRIEASRKGFALLSARVTTPEGKIRLAVTHLTRPWPFTAPQDQLSHIQRLETELSGEGLPLVVTGDFNTATHTGPMRQLRRKLKLTAPGAFTGTWPAPFPAIMRIGIDHIMVGEKLTVTARNTGPFYGSDHSPVSADIYWRRAKP